jgi:hypothetical protein
VRPPRPLAAFLAVAAALTVTAACGSDDGDEPAAASGTATAAAFEASQYAGTYAGTWTNEETGASGPVTIDIDIDEAGRDATLSIDFDGNYLGLGDPPAAVLQGTYDGRQAVAKGSSVLFGDYDVTIAADGAITGLMTDVGAGVIPRLEYTGNLTADRLDADYTATMGDGSTSEAILRMEKQ